jgi:probable rRNA maturation factor
MVSVNVSVEYATNCECPSTQAIESWMNAALTAIGRQTPATLALRIVDEDEMQAMNHRYRQKNTPTNVLSFPCQLPDNLKGDQLGDMLICAPVVQQEATAQHKSPQTHWAHMVVHGVLHLLGYDHTETAEAEQMEALEIDILKQLGFPNPYGATLSHD